MNVGLCTYNIAASELIGLAKAADETGFDSLWLGEHIVLPLDYGSEHPTTRTHDVSQGPSCSASSSARAGGAMRSRSKSFERRFAASLSSITANSSTSIPLTTLASADDTANPHHV